MTAGTASILTAIFATIRQTERRKKFLFVRCPKLDRKEKNSYLSKFGQKGKKLLFVQIWTERKKTPFCLRTDKGTPKGVYVCPHMHVSVPFDKGAQNTPLV